jgi:hydroxymethylpyrimidine pyrophosphatase-like HAD family hydrolase
MWERINLIFDLDETLVQMGKENYNNKGIRIKHNKFIFIRPYCKELLKMSYKKFNVSFWTSGSPKYCSKILSIILTESQLKKTKIIICKYNKYFLELKTEKIYKPIKYYLDEEVISHYVKSLNLLWNIEDFNHRFSIYNTLLVDDNFFLEKINPRNYIKISPWCRYMECDNSLLILKEWLEQNKKLLKTLMKIKKKFMLLNIINTPKVNDCLKNKIGKDNATEIETGNSYKCRENLLISYV